MLPAPLRMRSGEEFRATIRRGARAGHDSVMVYAQREDPLTHPGVRVGFVVSKAVGNAVTRNRVKRRLRHATSDLAGNLPAGSRVVVRAFPAAAYAGQLGDDLNDAWQKCLTKLDRRTDQR